jgi:hypothetical protein
MKLIIFSFLLISLLPSTSFATTESAPEYTYEQAKALAKESKWDLAEIAAKSVSGGDPKNVQNWFLLGIIENRLEHPIDAADAFSKVTELDPNGALAISLNTKLPELKMKSDEEKKYKYGPESSAFYLEYLPVRGSAIASELQTTLSSSFGLGFRFGKVEVGYRHAGGDVSNIKAVQKATVTPVPSDWTTVSGTGSLTMQELYFNFLIPIVEPYTSLGGFQFNIPIYMSGVMNTVNVGDKTYGSLGYDVATGLHLTYFTKTAIAFDLSAMYHLGIPFWSVRDNNANAIEGSTGTAADGGTTGFEVGLGVTFLFGAPVRSEE